MVNRRTAWLGLLLIVTVASCGSGDSGGGDPGGGGSGGSGTARIELEVTGVATTSVSPTPNSQEPAPPLPEPGGGAEVPFSGSLQCDGSRATGTGMFADNAVEVCRTVRAKLAVFTEIGSNDNRACAELYGGPQHARVEGTVAGRRVDLTVERNDGCGIDDWERLEWLLGPPER